MKPLKIQTDCPTRWSSMCVMIQHLLYNRVPIAATLAKLSASKDKVPNNLTEEEWSVLAGFEKILDPLRQATTIFQSQKIPTIGTAFPIIHNILSLHLDTTIALQQRQATLQQQGIAIPSLSLLESFKVRAGDHISKKFNALIGDWGKELTLSVFLDPRVKDFFFITNPITQQQLLASAKAFAEEEISKLQPTPQHQEEEEELSSGSVRFPTPSEDMAAIYSSFFGAGWQDTPSNDQEIQSYLQERRIPTIQPGKLVNPLKWWAANQHRYPFLAKLARKYLVLMTSSAAVERMFSYAGWVVDKRRCSLSDHSVESRLFFVANKQHLAYFLFFSSFAIPRKAKLRTNNRLKRLGQTARL